MLLLQMDIDLEEHKENWALGKYRDTDSVQQGQADYIMDLKHVITDFQPEGDIEDDES